MAGVNVLEDNEDYAPDYAYTIVNGTQQIPVYFERPTTGEPVFIIVRPVTKPVVALLGVRGFIWP